jgi:hypothetical protein
MFLAIFFYNPTIFRIMKDKLTIKIKLNKITNQRNFGILNKFLKGLNIININPIILLIKKRGYLTILVQKLFIIKNYLYILINIISNFFYELGKEF